MPIYLFYDAISKIYSQNIIVMFENIKQSIV